MYLLASPKPENLDNFRQHLLGTGALHTVGALSEYWEWLQAYAPDLIVLDLALTGLDWKEAAAASRARAPAARLVVLAPAFSEDDELALLGLGVAACCASRLPAASASRILDMVIDGGVWISHAVLPRILRQLQPQARPAAAQAMAPECASLTPREREIAHLVGSGASNKLIARELNITDRTVKAHLSAIFHKLGMPDRVRLALYINGGGARPSSLPTAHF